MKSYVITNASGINRGKFTQLSFFNNRTEGYKEENSNFNVHIQNDVFMPQITSANNNGVNIERHFFVQLLLSVKNVFSFLWSAFKMIIFLMVLFYNLKN